MIWLHAQDASYYTKDSIEQLKEEYKLKDILINPTLDEIRKELRDFNKFGILSYHDVPNGAEGFYVYKRLKAKHKTLTTQQKDYEITENEALYQRYGTKVIKPTRDFGDYGGGYKLKEWYKFVQLLKSRSLPVKPTFLLGVQGAGKSEFVICYAGETNSLMVDLNLSLIMEDERPLKKLNEVFEFLADTKIKATIRIDEITEMLKNDFLFGELLTILNEINTKEGYELNGELFASANRIDEINRTKPQFFRQGRWNKKFFMTYPTQKESYEIIDMYSKIYGNNFNETQIKQIYALADIAHEKTTLPNLSPYTPSEWNSLMLELIQFDGRFDKDIIGNHIDGFKPQTLTAMEGTYAILQQQKELCFEILNDPNEQEEG
jgi:hypothetical protein